MSSVIGSSAKQRLVQRKRRCLGLRHRSRRATQQRTHLPSSELDRLGRSTRDVLNLVHELDQKAAGLRVLEPEFCTSTDTGRILMIVLGMVAEMERRFIL